MPDFLITHGDRFYGPNPGHTPLGFEQIRSLTIPNDISLIIVGTGKRFREIYNTIVEVNPRLAEVPTKTSPFCGSADGLEANGNVILVDGTLVNLKNDYIGLSYPCFLPWRFIDMWPDRTLYCAGGELLIALGFKAINEKGKLYQLESKTAGCIKIS